MIKRPTVIYALIDPVTSEARYVGKTNQILRIRFTSHLRDRRPSRKRNWVQSVLSMGLEPKVEELEILSEEATEKDWQESERFWISYLRFIGADLTNLTDGGEGIHGLVFTEDHRRKIGDAHKGRIRSPETLKRMAESRKNCPIDHLIKLSKSRIGVPLSESHRMKIAAAGTGRKHSAETKAKMSIASKGRVISEETRRRISETLKKRAALKC